MISGPQETNTADRPTGRAIRVALVGAGALLVWLVVQRWLMPGLIRSAYDQESIPFFNAFIDGQARHPVGFYLDAWERVARLGTVALLVLVGLLVGSVRWHRRIYRASAKVHALLFRRGPTVKLPHALALGGIAGGLGGALEGVAALFDVRGEPSGPALEVLWMAPLAAGAVGACLALLTWSVAGAREVSARTLLMVVMTFAAFTALGSAGLGIHPAALLLLGLGAAVEVSRHLSRGVFVERPRRLLIGLALLLALGAGTMKATEAWAERRALWGTLGGAADQPNILLLILDTVRAQNLSLYGYGRDTSPNLVELARESVVFELALATSSWTLPSHASLLTGLDSPAHGADWYAPMAADPASIAEVLRASGYATGAFIANQAFGRRRAGMDRGFIAYRDNPADLDEVVENHWAAKALGRWVYQALGHVRGDARKTADEVNDELLGWLDDLEGRRFFAMVNYYDAHDPYESPPPFDTRFRPRPPRALLGNWGNETEYVAAEIAEMVDAYDSSIAYLDDRIGRLLAELERRGLMDETLLVVTSDHGEHFGERGIVLHGNSLYLPSLHVPLLIRMPERAGAGTRVPGAVSIRDVPATILDLARVGGDFPGMSMARLWQRTAGSGGPPLGGADVPGPALASLSSNEFVVPSDPVARGDMRSVTTDRFHYILNGDGVEELFDLTGAGEAVDLASDAAFGADLASLRAQARAAGTRTEGSTTIGAARLGSDGQTTITQNGQGRTTAPPERD